MAEIKLLRSAGMFLILLFTTIGVLVVLFPPKADEPVTSDG